MVIGTCKKTGQNVYVCKEDVYYYLQRSDGFKLYGDWRMGEYYWAWETVQEIREAILSILYDFVEPLTNNWAKEGF